MGLNRRPIEEHLHFSNFASSSFCFFRRDQRTRTFLRRHYQQRELSSLRWRWPLKVQFLMHCVSLFSFFLLFMYLKSSILFKSILVLAGRRNFFAEFRWIISKNWDKPFLLFQFPAAKIGELESCGLESWTFWNCAQLIRVLCSWSFLVQITIIFYDFKHPSLNAYLNQNFFL